MPRFDRTGPERKGPLTGRGLGKCNPKSQEPDKQIPSEDQERPAPMNRGNGRGQGRGERRRRRGSD